jgi:hypothetical protein
MGGWISKRDVEDQGTGNSKGKGKGEIQGFLPFDKLRVRMTMFFLAL